MSKYLLRLSAFVFLAAFVACSKADTVPSAPEATINYGLMPGTGIMGTETVSGTEDEAYGVFSWTGGMAAVSEIHIETRGAIKNSYSNTVPQVIDLFAAWNNLGSIKVPEGTYDSIEFRIVFAPTATHEALNMSGTFEKNNTVLPINVIINEKVDLSFVKNTPTKLEANIDYNAAGSMALTWLAKNVDEQKLWSAEKVNGTVVISKTVNADLYAFIWQLLNQGVLKVDVDKL